MNIGFLSPRSNAYPAIGLEFTQGLKQYLKKQQIEDDVHLITDSIAFGGSEKEVYEKAEKLLMTDDVDILLAFIDERVLNMLKPLLYASGKLMIVINAGANHPLNWVPQSNIINLTLQHAFCNWLSGSLAATQPAKHAATATTFYDCGYLHTASIVKSFVREGGAITFNFVTQDKYDDTFSVTRLTDFLSENAATNNVLCTFDSLPAGLFYKLMNKENVALFVSPMMLEAKALEGIDAHTSFFVHGYKPWNQQAESEANSLFRKTCLNNKKNETMFSLLGWETGMIVENILAEANGNYTNGAALADNLKTKEFDSPRGQLRLDQETNFFLAPLYKCSLAPSSTEVEITIADNWETEWQNFIEEPSVGVISGWTNTYLCY